MASVAEQYPQYAEPGEFAVITPLTDYVFGNNKPAIYLLWAASRQQQACDVYAGNRQQQERCCPEQVNRWFVVSKNIVCQRCNNGEFAGLRILRILLGYRRHNTGNVVP